MTTNARSTRPGAVLAVMCLAVFTVNVDTTIVNVTLPTLVSELGATTRDLQWIVDSYLLVFAALVLAGGSLSDRFGRRAVLLVGLAIFGLGNTLAAFADTPGQLIAARAFTGIGAAAVFPTTLSILTQVFRDRVARAKAIGLWGASTGLAVAFGPITGGALLEQYWWGSTFLVKLPIALVAIALVVLLVPESRDPEAPRIDLPGLVLSALGLAALVYTIIEAPGHGWDSGRTLLGFAVAAGLFAAFVRHERRTAAPMLDLRLFADRRFTAAALAITVAFFALFGFIFLITQYFQFLRGYSPLETGVRILPVALCVAAGFDRRDAARRTARQQGRGDGRPAVPVGGLRLDLDGQRCDQLPRDRRADGLPRTGHGPDKCAGDRVDHGGGADRQGGHRLGRQRRDA